MIQRIAGLFIFISFLITLYAYFIDSAWTLYSSLFAWGSLFLLFKYIQKKRLLYALVSITTILFVIVWYQGFEINISKALFVNQHLLVLLIGVGFLRLIATPKQGKIKALPKGEKSFLKTYWGIHLFGAVINLSSLILVSDRLYKQAPFTKVQLLLLTRAFSSDAYWSPFFVAFAAALTYAPNLSTPVILSTGLFITLIAFLVTYLEVKRSDKYDLNEFEGYPIHFETLYIPALLAVLVLVINQYFPTLKVIMLIALFSIILTIAILPMKTGLKKAIGKLFKYITEQLPMMRNELALFLIAGVFGVSLSTLLMGYNISMPFDNFNGSSATMLLLVLIVLSFVGIHPIISIAVIGNWMSQIDHTLLAMVFLMSWSTAVSTSPFSGVNLTLQARYQIRAVDIFKVNISYAIKMYLVCATVLLLLENYLLKL